MFSELFYLILSNNIDCFTESFSVLSIYWVCCKLSSVAKIIPRTFFYKVLFNFSNFIGNGHCRIGETQFQTLVNDFTLITFSHGFNPSKSAFIKALVQNWSMTAWGGGRGVCVYLTTLSDIPIRRRIIQWRIQDLTLVGAWTLPTGVGWGVENHWKCWRLM